MMTCDLSTIHAHDNIHKLTRLTTPIPNGQLYHISKGVAMFQQSCWENTGNRKGRSTRRISMLGRKGPTLKRTLLGTLKASPRWHTHISHTLLLLLSPYVVHSRYLRACVALPELHVISSGKPLHRWESLSKVVAYWLGTTRGGDGGEALDWYKSFLLGVWFSNPVWNSVGIESDDGCMSLSCIVHL